MSAPQSPTQLGNVSLADLKTMRLRVCYLNKEHERFKKNLSGSYDSLLKAIDNKLNHEQKESQKLSRHKAVEAEMQLNHEKVRAMRDKQQEELKNIKTSYFAMKKQESAQIKQMQKIQRTLALRKQEQEAERKKEMAEKIKSSHQQVKILKEKVIEEKRSEVEKIKRTKNNNKYPHYAANELNLLQEKANILAGELSFKQSYDRIIDDLAQQTNKMNLQEFHKIVKQLRLSTHSREDAKKKLAYELLKRKNIETAATSKERK